MGVGGEGRRVQTTSGEPQPANDTRGARGGGGGAGAEEEKREGDSRWPRLGREKRREGCRKGQGGTRRR